MVRASGGWYFEDTRPGDYGPLPDADLPRHNVMPPGYGDTDSDVIAAAWQYSDWSELHRTGQMGWNWRCEPDNQAVVPLISSFGWACRQIPALKRASLVTSATARLEDARLPSPSISPRTWGVWFFESGEATLPRYLSPVERYDPLFFDKDVITRRRVLWDVGAWRPGRELETILGGIGHTADGIETLQLYVDSFTAVRRERAIERLLQFLTPRAHRYPQWVPPS